MEVSSRYITIKTHVQGSAYESDFELKVASLGLSAEPGSDEIILRNLFVSIDPAQINRMKSYSSSQKSVKTESGIIPGQVYHQFMITVQLDAANSPPCCLLSITKQA
jgi:NADPH-dependent curcumin reductase CurA